MNGFGTELDASESCCDLCSIPDPSDTSAPHNHSLNHCTAKVLSGSGQRVCASESSGFEGEGAEFV